jgi:KDO2-lipid IV(A) lauroyltransferase
VNPLLAGLLRLLLFSAGLAVSLLPRSWELRLARILGWLFLSLDWKRKPIARENMARCLPELSQKQREDLLAQNYVHYGALALELLHYFSPLPGHWRAYVKRIASVEGLEHWERAKRKGKGVLFISGHMANWEIMGAIGCLLGMPLLFVTRRLKPEWLHRRIESERLSVGLRAVYQPRTLPAVLRALRAGGGVGFAMDQYMHPPMDSPIPFFGVRVNTLAAVPPILSRTGAALIPATQRREPDGRIRIILSPELEFGPDLTDADRVTTRINAEMERIIRENPSQWLWVHRRFKNLEVQSP